MESCVDGWTDGWRDRQTGRMGGVSVLLPQDTTGYRMLPPNAAGYLYR